MKFLICLITGCILILSLLSACTPPCWTPRDIEMRSDCNAFGQVIAGIDH